MGFSSYTGGITAYSDLIGNITNCTSSFNTITGNVSAGVIAYSNSYVASCYINGNNFLNYSTFNVCVAENFVNQSYGCIEFTNAPSTNPPSTNPPSTNPPSTNSPSTTPPSTNPPSTNPPSTNPPSTTPPSTNPPSTNPPSTNPPSTTPPSTTQPSTNPPSTSSPQSPSTNPTSSLTPSTTFPSTVFCSYVVPNCENCGQTDLKLDATLFNISCINVNGKWSYSFKNKSSDTTFINQPIFLNDTSIIIEGNFNLPEDNTIFIVLSNDKSGSLNVTGCVSLNGNLSLILNDQPVSDNFSIVLISYNCSDTLNISDSQLQISTTYKNSQCDQVSSKINNQQNSLSVTISSQLNSNCKTNSII